MPEAVLQPEETGYGVFYCKTGAEEAVIRSARRSWPEAEFLAARIVKKQTDHRRGGDCFEEAAAFPGYVFFRAPLSFEPVGHPADLYRVLKTDDTHWQLKGSDLHIARWLFEHNGLMGMSKAYREGDEIIIDSGPLKDLRGFVTRIDKRNAKGQVELEVNGRKLQVWLCFEWLRPKKETNPYEI